MNDIPDSESSDRVECPAVTDPAVKSFIIAAMLLGLGIYCFIDGHIRDEYPYKPLSQDVNVWLKWAFNYYGPFVLIPLGLVALIWGIVALRRKLVADANGIGYLRGEQIAWDRVEKLDVSLLESKGVLKLHHGLEKPLVLDSWRLRNFKALVAFVEGHVPAEAKASLETVEPSESPEQREQDT